MRGLDLSPFEINLLRRPTFPLADGRVRDTSLTPVERGKLEPLLSLATDVGLLVKHRLQARQDAQAVQYDKAKRTQKFAVGDLVLLDREGISVAFLNKPAKLSQAYLGPFKVKRVDPDGHPDTYELELPLQLGGLHPVFHTRLLRKWEDPAAHRYRTVETPPDPVLVDGQTEYYIERILAQRTSRGKLQYYVKWLGYPNEDAQWINASELDECEAVDVWLRDNPPSQTQPSRKRKRR